MKVYDLTHALADGMKAFPGDPDCEIKAVHLYEGGYYVSKLSMCTHMGTHIDVPVHRIPEEKCITDYPVDHFIAWNCAVLDVGELEGEVDAAFLQAHAEELQGCDGVLLRSGWDRNWGSEAFFAGFPGIHESAAEQLVKMGIRILGMEGPSVNPERHDSVHSALLSEEIVIVEALRGLDQLDGRFEFYAVPLKITNGDGSPVRAFAVQRG